MTENKTGPLDQPSRYAGAPRSPDWPSMIERLLLSIIDANPDERRDRQSRLNQAYLALFGKPLRKGRRVKDDFENVLAMLRLSGRNEYYNSFVIAKGLDWPLETEIPHREQARTVLRESRDAERDPADMGPGRRGRRKRQDPKIKEYGLTILFGDKIHEEIDQSEALLKIQSILEPFNVKLVIDHKKLGLYSFVYDSE
jgi:hypothetical protein